MGEHHEDGQACCGACDVAGKTERGEITFPTSAPLVVGDSDTDLAVRTEDGVLRKFELRRANRFVVGRKADLKIDSAMASSRIFCLEVTEAGEVFAQDVGSACGTYVNGRQAQGRQRICEKDLIQVGGAVMRFEQGGLRDDLWSSRSYDRAAAPSEGAVAQRPAK